MAPIDPRNLGPTLEKAATKFRANSDKRMARRNTIDSPTETLFHYTSQAAFESIISTEEFWFTSIYHMDDTEELTFGFDVCSTMLNSLFASVIASERIGRLLQLFIEPLIETGFREEIKSIVEFYSASFGARDDSEQWARYGDKENGVAIGLSPKFFIPLAIENPKPEERIYFGKVIYGEIKSKAQHSRVIQSAVDFIKKEHRAGTITGGEVAQALFRRLMAEMYCEVLWNCVITKGDGWKHQNETRLLVLNSKKKPELQVHLNGQRPFVKIPQPTLRQHLDEVMIGSKASEAVEDRVRLFLTQNGLEKVRVSRSVSVGRQ
jgi:hypothetical protein